MSNTYFGVTARKINARRKDGTTVEVRLSTFICMYNDLHGGWEPNPRAQARMTQRLNNYEKAKPAEFFVEHVNTDRGLDDLIGSAVFVVPEGYDGAHDEYYFDDIENPTMGTLLKDEKNKWYIEEDLEIVEIIRRGRECRAMRNGNLHIGEFSGKNVPEYITYLDNRDNEQGAIVTRGHGLRRY